MKHFIGRYRNLWLVAAPLSAAVLVVFCLLQSADDAAGRRSTGTALQRRPAPDAPRPQRSSPAADESPEAYQIISQRNLFRPLVLPRKHRVQRSIERYVSPPVSLGRLQPLPPLTPMPVPRTPPASSAPVPPQSPAHSQPSSASPTGGVTVVGTVNVNGVWHGVVEDTTRGETRFIRVGEEAFGYRLKSIDEEHAILEKGGKSVTLRLGAYKEDKPVRPAGAPRGPNPSPSQGVVRNAEQN